MYIPSELPAMSSKTNIIMNYDFKCSLCGRGECFMKGDKIYERSSLEAIKDFNLSKEWFGSCLGIWRVPFASQRVYRLFQEHNIKGVRFVPATVVE